MRRAPAAGALLAIDAGSSRTRATVISTGGEVLAAAAAAPPSVGEGGAAAVLPGERLWRQLVELIREIRPERHGVIGVAVAAQLGAILVDDRGRPVDDALLWPDGRAADEARALRERIGPSERLLGRRVSAELPAAKLLWWRRHRHAAVEAARWILSLKDFLVMRLTGVAVVDETHASYTGWFDVVERAYSPTLIRACRADAALLPPVRGAQDVAGAIGATTAKELGLAEGTPVAVGGPDGAVGALGGGAARPGVTVDVAGTTDVVVSVAAEPHPSDDQGAVLNAYVLPRRWAVGGPTGMTGGGVEWVSRLLGFASAADAFARLGAEAIALPIGCEGLSFDPVLSGSRMPAWNRDERGVLAGLAPHHSAAHLLRAAYEGAAFVVQEGIDAVRGRGVSVDEVVIVGGVAGRRELVQLRSDLWGVPVRIAEAHEATTLGAAMLAGIAAGAFEDGADAVAALGAPTVTVAPRPGLRGAAEAARRRWQATAEFSRTRPAN